MLLHEFITENRDEIIGRCKKLVTSRVIPPPTPVETNHGVPLFLDQLTHSLRLGLSSNPAIADSATLHGHDLLLQGFTISQVVHDYGDVCQTITDMALEKEAPIATDDFRTLNKSLDDAIAGAVTQYGREKDETSIGGESARGSERLGFLVHEMRSLINSASLSFEALKSGNVGVAGSTGAVLARSLRGMTALVSRSLDEVRLTQAVQQPEQIPVPAFIAELVPAATLEASARAITLRVLPVEDGIAVMADRQVLAATVMNVLQNAFKFTRPRTTVTLRVSASAERVLIEVQDECGGLPGGDVNELFRPLEQQGAHRTGVGLGLAYCRWAVEANHGRIYALNLADKGCILTIDLPRLPVPAMVG